MSAAALVALALVAAPPLAGHDAPVFSRPEPHLLAGSRLLRAGEPVPALESFRRATARDANERAVVEYDVGQALVLQAQLDASAAPEAGGGPPKIDVESARASFDRAFGMATDAGLKSEAALASGNAAALAGDIDGAISSFRKALVADPSNLRAKKNLLRALAAKRAQPPPPPQEGGDGENQDGDDDQSKHDENKADKDKQGDAEKNEDEQNRDDKDKQGAGTDENKDDKDKQGGGKDGEKDGEKDEASGAQRDEQKEKEKEKDGASGAQAKPSAKQQKKDEARKLLDALRSREKPLSPLEMRGTGRTRPKGGKDW